MQWVQQGICRALNLSLDGLAGRLFPISIRGRLNNALATFDHDGQLKVTEAFHLLRATLETTKARLVVLDNVAHLFAGNENDRGHVTAFVNLLYQLCRDLGVTIVLIAHVNKQYLQGNKEGNSSSGSTAWLNAVRSQLVIERPADSLDRDARVLRIGKANYARPDEETAFRWHDFALIRDDDLPADQRASLAAMVNAGAEDDAFLACLAKATEERRATSASSAASNYAPRVFAKMTTGKGISERGFESAMERLLHRCEIVGDQRVYQRQNRTWAMGLACTNHRTNHAQTPAQSLHEAAHTPRTDLHPPRTLDTTYLSGAAPSGPAAPDRERRDLSWTMFPRPQPVDQSASPPPVDDVASVARLMTQPLPERLRDPFNPQHWPEDDE